MTGKKDNSELQAEVETLRKEVALLHEANAQLIARNMVLAEQVEMGYEVRRRIDWLKELIRKHRDFMESADKKDDSELLAIIETRLEQENIPLPPSFGIKQIAELAGVTQSRIASLYKTKTIYKSVDEYLDYLRLLRTLRMLHEIPTTTWRHVPKRRALPACAPSTESFRMPSACRPTSSENWWNSTAHGNKHTGKGRICAMSGTSWRDMAQNGMVVTTKP